MPKDVSQEKGLVEQFLRAQTKPLRVSEILSGFISKTLAKRSLQRYLTEWVNDGVVARIGGGRSTAYLWKNKDLGNQFSGEILVPEVYIPLSVASFEIRDYVRQAIGQREPVSCDRGWVDEYKPNETYYLPEKLRAHLLKLGNTEAMHSPMGTYGRYILDRLLIDLSWSSSKLEGNTYSLLDTQKLIEAGEEAEGKYAIETQMILNHKRAIEFLVEEVEEIGFNRYTFLNLHGLLSDGLLADPSASGRVRMRSVNISGTTYKPNDIHQQLSDTFDQLLLKAEKIQDPFEQAFFILVHIPYLQPFEDVNKRVSRIGCNIAFIKRNLCPLTFLDAPQDVYIEALLGVYEMQRIDMLRDFFVWAYERSTKQYIAVKNTLEVPDPLQIKYRKLIQDVVNRVITELHYPYINVVREDVEKIVLEEEKESVHRIICEVIERIHEGVLARYRLRPSQLKAWLNLRYQKK